MVTVKIKLNDYYYNSSYVTIDGQTYTGGTPTTITVPVGTVIYCCCYAYTKGGEAGGITLNGTEVEYTNEVFGMQSTYEYEHTVNWDVEISFRYEKDSHSYIDIIEIPEGYAFVKFTGSGGQDNVYVSIDGVQYTATGGKLVPIGTVIYFFTRMNENASYGYIKLNGDIVAQDSSKAGVGYNYTVNGNLYIHMYHYKAGGYITITET